MDQKKYIVTIVGLLIILAILPNIFPSPPPSRPGETTSGEVPALNIGMVIIFIMVVIVSAFAFVKKRKSAAVAIVSAPPKLKERKKVSLPPKVEEKEEISIPRIIDEEYYIAKVQEILKSYGEIKLTELASKLNIDVRSLRSILEKAITENKLSASIKNGVLVQTMMPVEKQITPTTQEIAPPAVATTLNIPGYKILGVIGAGGFATVFRAKDPQGRVVALKVLNMIDENTKKMFVREVSIWRSLEHPNIVRLIAFDSDPLPYLAMELMEESLRQQILRGRIDLRAALDIILEIAFALDYAHSEFMIVHRDIKPENILYKNGVYKLSDWGLARVQTAISTSGYKGTIAYSAPEQLDASFGSIGPWTDVWQLGVVLYELVTGELPFGSAIGEAVRRILYDEPKRTEYISDELWDLIINMLKKKPQERITMKDVIKRLREIQK